MHCRFCNTPLKQVFVDLGHAPPSNSFLEEGDLCREEARYPLKLFVCGKCFLVQTDEYKASSEIFNAVYPYFSSYSSSWLRHAEAYVEMITEKCGLSQNSLAIEIASNDGYLLQYFSKNNIPVLGIEPSDNVASKAREKGIETIGEFFNNALASRLVSENRSADLLIGNNVFAHVPQLNDFVKGLKTCLKPAGAITLEFPHLVKLIEENQFDTIYHEHFSYFSLHSAQLIFQEHELDIFDVDELPTHGGSLRIYGKHVEDGTKEISDRVPALLAAEKARGVCSLEYYEGFQEKVDIVKMDLLEFFAEQAARGNRIAAYGAAAKGNTLLNYCGITKDNLDFVVDASPHKQGKFLPGSRVPVESEYRLKKEKPAFVVILPWNLREEITRQLEYIREWQGQFVIPVPSLEIF